MKKWIVLAALTLLVSASVKADEISELKQQLAEQSRLLRQMQEQLQALESKQQQQDEQIEQKVAKAVDEKKIDALPDSIKWVENVKISGDLRYRYEYIDEDKSGNNDRTRNRIRARLGFDAKVNDDVDVCMRIATSEVWGDDATSGDPVSTNQTLDDAFSKKSIWLDLAYFDWHPSSIEGLNVFGGKMENPFVRVGGNQLIFDSDLTPEGIAVNYTIPFSESTDLFINGGGFYVDEVKTGADTSLWGLQAGLKHRFEDDSYLLAGASKYCYSNLEGHGALVTQSGSAKFFGNSNDGSVYTNDYDLVELFGEYGFKMGETPAAVFGNYVQNAVASSNEDTGWLIGGKLGKAKKPGSWELSYDYRDLEADAVVGAFSESDFIGGGTNGKGHRFGGVYQLAKNVQTAMTYFMDEKGSEENDYSRFQADLIFKF
ncbi:MAG: putative porin [Phycisphaerae bacterium]|nr:putative porin [Phycisphaerae bacterium]